MIPAVRAEPFSGRKIAVCHLVSAEQWAGAEAQIAMLLRYLSRDPALSLSAIVLGQGRLGNELTQCGIETALITQSGGRFFNSFCAASRFLRGKHVDVLHSHKSKEGVLALLLAKRFGIPFLVRTQHGMPEARTSKDRIVFGIESMTKRLTSRIVCVSGDLKQRLASEVSCKKLTVIRNAIDLARVQSHFTVAEAKMRLGIAPENSIIGLVGRLDPVKRVDLFLDAARHISRELPSAYFVIAGSGRDEATLRGSLRGSELEGRVLFLGGRDDIYDVLRAMDLLLITSDHEGLPTVLLEAMAMGVPVVARNIGGIGEVIRDNVSGMLVNSPDATMISEASLQLLSQGSLRARVIAEGMDTARHFSAEHNAANYMQLYQSLVMRPARR